MPFPRTTDTAYRQNDKNLPNAERCGILPPHIIQLMLAGAPVNNRCSDLGLREGGPSVDMLH